MSGLASRAADFTVTIEPRWRQERLEVPSSPQVNLAGQELRVTRLAALFSSLVLLRADGSRVQLDGQYGFFDAGSGRQACTWQGVPTGDFVGLELNIGLPADVNLGDPGRWPAGHPLNPLVNGLHWSWQGGYVFFAVEGFWSQAKSGPSPVTGRFSEGAVERPAAPAARSSEPARAGLAERGFSYHLATAARKVPLRFLANFRVGGDTTVALALDLARILAALRIASDDGSESTHSAEGDVLAERLAAGLSRCWFWLEARPDRADERLARAAVGGTGASAARGAAGLAASAAAVGSPLRSTRTEDGQPVAFMVPAGFPQPALPADNPLTVAGIALGESLFSDKRLAGNGAQSCASCHVLTRALSDAVALSPGSEGELGVRNAMPLFNLAWSPAYAWDSAQRLIRDQALAAWTNPIEMRADPRVIVAELARDAALGERFAAAFGSAEITPEKVTLALEQFLLVQVSADAKFDRALRGEISLSEEEKRGFELFAMEYDPVRDRRGADCFHCHGGALFSDYTLKNNGLEQVAADIGREKITGQPADRAKFKTPSLRNAAITGPYMHDGRFTTLAAVVAHYDHGVQRTATLDPNLAKHPDAGLSLSADDQRALVAFLRTLTDERFLNR